MKKLYEDKIENEIDKNLKNIAFERKKFKIEHTNNLEHMNKFATLENHPDIRPDIKVEHLAPWASLKIYWSLVHWAKLMNLVKLKR